MEGGGEGMVAIVQGLQDAGLAVTVLKRRYLDGLYMEDGARATPREKCSPPTKCTVETCTQAQWTKRTAVQICDDPYTSTYQLAHCSIRSSSPPDKLEFPRFEPSNSNFEVRRSIGQDAMVDTPVRDVQAYGRSMSPGRGIQSTISSRTNEAFADSLRRYPLSPEHQSSDLVTRLLTHTQAKNILNNKAIRSSLKDKTADISIDPKWKTKSIQTYTRMRSEKESPAAMKDMKNTFNTHEAKKRRVQSPVNYKTIKYKDNQLNETYDYLKSTSPRYTRATEVRYLEDVSRCIKETLRQIMEDNTVECPQVQSRYCQHRRVCKKNTRKVSNDMKPQDELPAASKDVTVDRSSYGSTCPNYPSICSYCAKPVPCTCNNIPSTLSPRRQTDDPETVEDNQTNEFFKEEIFNWLQEIPVYANITQEDKEKREKMSEDLAKTLMNMRNDECFEAKAKNAIMKCLSVLPMWTPIAKSEQEIFLIQLCNNLINRLSKLTDKRSKINNKIKFKDIELQDDFEKEIIDWFNDIPDMSEDSATDIRQNKKLIEDLAKDLLEVQCEGVDDETVQEQMLDKLNDWLESAIKKKSMLIKFKTKQELIQKLIEKLISAAKCTVKDTSKTFSFNGGSYEDYFKLVSNWLDNIPELSGDRNNKKQEMIKSLATKLQDLRSETAEDEEKIQSEIFTWVAKEAEKQGTQLDSKTQNQLINKLLSKINKIPAQKRKTAYSFEDSVNEDYFKQVSNWFKDIPELARGSKFDNQWMVQYLATLLHNLRSEGIEDEDHINNEISNWLVKEAENKDVKLSSISQDQLVNKLVTQIKKFLAPKHEMDLKDSLNVGYLNQICDWLQNIPELNKANKFEKQRMVQSLVTKLQNLRCKGVEDEAKIQNKIVEWLGNEVEKRGTKSSLKNLDALANLLIGKIKKIPATRPKTKLSLEDSLNEYYLDQVWDWLKDIPEFSSNSTSEYQEIIDSLAKKLQNLHANAIDDKEEIQKEISSWLGKETEKKGTKLSSKSQGELTDKIVAKIKNLQPLRQQTATTLEDRVDEDYLKQINDSFEKSELINGSKTEKQKMIHDLATMLQKLYANGVKDKNEKQKEISSCLGKETEKDGTKLSSKPHDVLADKLIAKIKNLLQPIRQQTATTLEDRVDEDYLKQINDSFENISELTNGSQSEKLKMVHDLATKFQNLLAKGVEDENEKQKKISSWLGKETEKNGTKLISKPQGELDDKLIAKIKNIQPIRQQTATTLEDRVDEDYLKQINDSFENISELTNGSQSEKQKMVHDLATKLQNLLAKGVEDENDIQKKISSWLGKETEKNGTKLISKPQGELDDKLIAKIKNVQPIRQQTATTLEDRVDEDYLKEINDSFENISELTNGSQSEKQNMIHDLATMLHNLYAKGVEDENDIQKEISSWLVKEIEKKNTTLDPKSRDIADKLVTKIKTIQPPKYKTTSSFVDSVDKDFLAQIFNWFENILPELDQSSKSENEKLVQSLATKLHKMQSKGLENEEEMQNNDKEAEKNGTKLNSKTKDQLAKMIKIPVETSSYNSNNSKFMAKPRKHWEVNMPNKNTDEFMHINEKTMSTSLSPITLSSIDIKKCIKKEINNILDKHQLQNRNKINSNLTDILHDQIMRQDDENTIKQDVFYILKDANISDEDAKKLSDRLISSVKELSFINKDPTISSQMTSSLSELTSVPQQDFPEVAERTILDFIERITGNQSPPVAQKVREETAKVIQNLSDVLTFPERTTKEKEHNIRDEVSQFLEKLSLLQNDAAEKLTEHIQNLVYKTSTPRESKLGNDFSIPKRDEASISAIFFYENVDIRNQEKDKHIADLITAIQIWAKEMSIDLNETLLNSILIKLAEEIAERQKYLQIHSQTKTSEEEELEHLKYQVFKCFNKALDMDNLLDIMGKLDSLLTEVNKICVPQLASSTRPEMNVAETTISNALYDEICKWVEENLTSFVSSDVNENMKNLTNVLQRVTHNNGTNTYVNMEKEISEWLSSTLKHPNNIKAKAMVEDLRSRLKDKYFAESWDDLSPQTSSQFIIENLKGAILDFLKTLPLYQKRNYDEKRIQEKLSAELAESLQKLLAASLEINSVDFDELIINEIHKYLKKFPIEPMETTNDNSLINIAHQLLDYLKHLQLFQDISARNLRSVEEQLIDNVEDWFTSLPINNNRTPIEKLHCDDLKENLLSRLKQIWLSTNPADYVKRDEAMKEEIKKILQTFPIEHSKRFDHIYLHDKVEQLSKQIQQLLSSGDRKPTISCNFITDTILNWSKSIPLQNGKTTNDISNAINSFSKRMSNILSTGDAYSNKSKLQEETMNFLKQLPVQIDKRNDKYLKNVMQKLINQINERSGEDISTKSLPKPTDVLYDGIKNWCNDLPIAGGSAAEEIERVKTIKQSLANKLINKVIELNMNPEIFNDDILYEDLLQDAIDNMLSKVPSSPELESNATVLKKKLIEKIRNANHKIKDELAGQAYKQQLRDTVLNILPPLDISSSEELVSFEDLKNRLADAYINLHYVEGTNGQRNKYKKKIADAIEKFSNNYLQRYPGRPLDTKKINNNLYRALKKVPLPKDETLRSEVEQVRIKNEIDNWIKELPLKEESDSEKVQRSKKVVILAKCLYELEKEKEIHPELDIDNKIAREISKWLKKLPLRPGEDDINELTKQFINKLKSTEQSRKISASTTIQSIEAEELDSSSADNSSSRHCSRHVIPFPASSLTVDDRAHMEKIRQRSIASTSSNQLPQNCKDAAISPLPIDASSQTKVMNDAPGTNPRVSNHTQPCQETNSKAEVPPKIIIKEYFWGASNSKLNESVYRIPCLSSQPSCGINTRISPSCIKVTCPGSSSVSYENISRNPTQIPPYLGPIVTRPSSQMQDHICNPSTQMSQHHSNCMSQHEKPYTSNNQLLSQMQRPCFQPPYMGSSQIRPNSIANQQYPWPESGRQVTHKEKSYISSQIPLSPPCMPSSVPCMPSPVTCIPPCTRYTSPKSSQAREVPVCTTPRPVISKKNTTVPFRQPCFSLDMAEDTPVETNNQGVGLSSSNRERVTKLGSLDDIAYPNPPCRRQLATISIDIPEKSSRCDGIRFPNNKKIWDTPCYRPKIYRKSYEKSNGKSTTQALKGDQIMRCRRRDSSPTRRRSRSRGSHHSSCQSCESVRRCPKCCGTSCPHPSGFYFR